MPILNTHLSLFLLLLLFTAFLSERKSKFWGKFLLTSGGRPASPVSNLAGAVSNLVRPS